MIAKIKLNEFIEPSVFEELSKITNIELSSKRVGQKYSSMARMGDDDYYEDECVLIDDEYYLKDNRDKKISSYRISSRPDKVFYALTDESRELVIDLDYLASICPTLKYSVEQIVPIKSNNDTSGITSTMHRLMEKIDDISDRNFSFNQKCNVHVSGFGLLSIKEVDYKEDLCTLELQDILNTGWRIIACCVQPDQRRPDYILGKMELPE